MARRAALKPVFALGSNARSAFRSVIRVGVGVASVSLTALVVLAWPAPASAHGYAPPPDSVWSVLFAWQLEASVLLPLLAAALIFRWAVHKVNAAHPKNPVPHFRYWSWMAGLFVLLIALASPIGTYDTTLFSVHMVQHLLLTMVAAPLLVMGAPITLLLRVSSPETRQHVILPVLHSWPVKSISFPVVTWIIFAAVMWGSHFTPLFNAALDDPTIHLFEHALYLGAGLLFWWPVVGADPSPWRLSHPARIAYLFLGLPQSGFLGLAILSAPGVLYSHYATLVRPWGPSPIDDQAWAGGIMWAGGDMMFLIAMLLAMWAWLRAEDREGLRLDAQLDREEALNAKLLGALAPDSALQPASTIAQGPTD